MLMLFRMLINKEPLPKDNMKSERKTRDYCEPILAVLSNSAATLDYFDKAVEIIKFSKLNIDDKQLVKQVNFTTKLKEAFTLFTKLNNL
jgi:hypothetical protein